MRSNSATTTSRGFTLIEVVIATFIVGVSLIAVVGTIQSITQQSARLEEKFIANLVANNTLVQLQLSATWPEIGEQDQETEMAGRDWFSDIKIEATDVETLRRVEISVGIDDDEREPSSFLVGFIGASSSITQNPVDWLNQNNSNTQNPNPNNPSPINPNPNFNKNN